MLYWEDRLNRGNVNGYPLAEKPNLGFNFAYISLKEGEAEYAPSHDFGVANRSLAGEKLAATEAFIAAFEPPVVEELVETPESVLYSVLSDLQLAYANEKDASYVKDGVSYFGGRDSAASIRDGVQAMEYKDISEITIRDIDYAGHVFTLADAMELSSDIAMDYQAKLQAFGNATSKARAVDLTAEDAIDQLRAISFEAELAAYLGN